MLLRLLNSAPLSEREREMFIGWLFSHDKQLPISQVSTFIHREREREREREMAMGGGSHKAKAMNNGSRGRSYGLMLLLAFGAALFGVMVLHRFRERRIFTLLVKEKDYQLFSLHLLLQKENEYSKEMKTKTEEMKAKLHSLRTQKMELDRRLIEMQSTIDSLKDEQKAMESALVEKQNEIKMQSVVTDLGQENSQLTAVKEMLMQKEAEIVDLKRHLEYPTKIWSVSTDDPSNPPVNLTNTINMTDKDLHMSTNSMAGENSTRVEDTSEMKAVDTNAGEVIVEQFQKLENTQDGDQAKENDSKEHDGFSGGDGKIVANSTEQIVDDDTTLGKLENSQDENQGSRFQAQGSRFQARSRLRRNGRLTRTKRKRLRILAKNRDSENNGLASMGSGRVYRESKGKGGKTEENPQKERKAVNTTQVELPKVGIIDDSEYLKNIEVNADPNQQVEQAGKLVKSNDSLLDTEMIENKNANGEVSNITNYANKQKLDEVRQPEEEASGTQQNKGGRDINDQENEAIQVKDGSENLEDTEVADKKEPETEATDGDSLRRESASNLEEDNKENKEETDESEF